MFQAIVASPCVSEPAFRIPALRVPRNLCVPKSPLGSCTLMHPHAPSYTLIHPHAPACNPMHPHAPPCTPIRTSFHPNCKDRAACQERETVTAAYQVPVCHARGRKMRRKSGLNSRLRKNTILDLIRPKHFITRTRPPHLTNRSAPRSLKQVHTRPSRLIFPFTQHSLFVRSQSGCSCVVRA